MNAVSGVTCVLVVHQPQEEGKNEKKKKKKTCQWVDLDNLNFPLDINVCMHGAL